MNESQLTDRFIAFLVSEKGFPLSVLRSEFRVSNPITKKTIAADLVVLDPYRTGFTALFELVGSSEAVDSQEKRQQLMRYRAALGKVHRAAYLVGPARTNGKRFLIQEVFDENTAKEVTEQDFPDFQSLLLGESAKQKVETEQQTDTTVDSFKKLCWSLAIVVTVVLILDVSRVVTLNAQQLTLLGLATGLALAPYAAKFKFLGIEWEREKAEAKKPPSFGK